MSTDVGPQFLRSLERLTHRVREDAGEPETNVSTARRGRSLDPDRSRPGSFAAASGLPAGAVSQTLAGSIRSTKSARQAGGSNGFAKYSVIRATLPSRISPMPT